MELKLPSRADADLMSKNLLTLTKMAVHLIDVVPRIRLSKMVQLEKELADTPQGKQKTEKNRAKLAEIQHKQTHAERQEAAQQRKLEKKQKVSYLLVLLA